MRFALMGALALVCAAPAGAVVIGSGTRTDVSNTFQFGRLVETGVPSTWANPKAFPGTTPGTFYQFASSPGINDNYAQPIYYEYTITNLTNTPIFVSAYGNGNAYFGDIGSSLGLNETGTFQTIVPTGQRGLTLQFTVNSNTSVTYAYTFSAFSDANRGENFVTVPEPSSWSMLILGFGFIGGAMRRQRLRLRLA